jgi:hypothetical protein
MDTLGGNLHQPLTQNLYLYTGGNPVNVADPGGHGWLGNARNAVTNVSKTVVNAVVITAKAVVNTETTVVKNVVNTVQSVVNNVIKPAVNAVASAVQNAASTAVTWVTNGVQSIVAAIGNSGGTSGSIPQKIGKGDTVLGTTLDMDVVTLSILNRHLCSADSLKATSKKRLIIDKKLELGAIVLMKPVENGALALLGQEHMSLILSNSSEEWYYVSYLGSSLKVKKISDTSVLTSLSKINQHLKSGGFVGAEEKSFTRSAFVPGDFTAALRQAKTWSDNPNSIPYEKVPILDNIFDALANLEDSQYSLFFNNCGHVAMDIFGLGIGKDGSTYVNKLDERLSVRYGYPTPPSQSTPLLLTPSMYFSVIKDDFSTSSLPRYV